MDGEIATLMLRILGYKCLNEKETRYLIWKYGFRKTGREIAMLDDMKSSKQSSQIVNMVILRSCRKIKSENR